MNVGIMQPYMFPYIGYFQLIKAVDVFVLYDDVSFIKKGWINRNRILLNNTAKLITFPCVKASQNKLINEVQVNLNDKAFSKLLMTIRHAYLRAPNFSKVFPLVEFILTRSVKTISELSSYCVIEISKYLNLETKFIYSSVAFSDSKDFEKSDRLISICKTLNATNYINAIGGVGIYGKSFFEENGISLSFLKPSLEAYHQFSEEFVSGLSIIDVLMFNSVEQIKDMISQYELL